MSFLCAHWLSVSHWRVDTWKHIINLLSMNLIFKCDSKQKTSDNLTSAADTSKKLFFPPWNTLKQSFQKQHKDMNFVHHNQMPAPPILGKLLKMHHFRWTKHKGDQRRYVQRRFAVCEVSHTSSKIFFISLSPDLCFISNLSNHL